MRTSPAGKSSSPKTVGVPLATSTNEKPGNLRRQPTPPLYATTGVPAEARRSCARPLAVPPPPQLPQAPSRSAAPGAHLQRTPFPDPRRPGGRVTAGRPRRSYSLLPLCSLHLFNSAEVQFPPGSGGARVRGSAARNGARRATRSQPRPRERQAARRGRREGRGAVRSRGADWPWPPMCLCLCGSRCCCQHAPKVCARQPASAARGPIAEPPRSPDSWPALALVYFRPDVTTGADFKVGTVHLGSPLGWVFFFFPIEV